LRLGAVLTMAKVVRWWLRLGEGLKRITPFDRAYLFGVEYALYGVEFNKTQRSFGSVVLSANNHMMTSFQMSGVQFYNLAIFFLLF
jgi:hypothetical protein